MSGAAGWVRRPADVSTTGPLLIDTHIWVWYIDGDAARLTPATVSLLDRSAGVGGLRLSDISCWEVAVKTGKGALAFSIEAMVWISRARKAPGLSLLGLDRDVLLLSTRLPGTVRNDPADRMIIATAKLHDLPLVTADSAIVDYAAAHPGLTVVDARPEG